MKLDLLGGSYQSRYVASNPQRTINWYPVISGEAEGNKNQISLFPTPGLSTYVTLPGRYARGLFTFRSHLYTKCFAIVDNILYEIKADGGYTTVATLSNIKIGSDRIMMECNLQNELFIGGYDASYVYDLDTSTLTQVTDVDFPNNVDSVTYLDQYMIVAANGAVYESLTTSALNWDVTQTYSPTFKSAPVIAVGALREQIFNFTTETIEVFINDGTSPYSRLPRSTMLTGILAKDSLATWSDGFIFLGKNRNGEAAVFFFDGWNPPSIISDSSVTWQLNQGTNLDTAFGYVQETKDGHYWYYLTVPSIDHTFVYDISTKLWHWRQSTKPFINSDGTTDQGYFRGVFHTNFNGMNLFLDAYSGQVLKEDYTVFTEASSMIRRERTSPIIAQDDKYLSIKSMIIDTNSGQQVIASNSAAPVLQVSWSNNGGYTFGEPKEVSLGLRGTYLHRTRLNQLGTARRKVFRFVLTDPVDVMIQAAYVEGSGSKY